MKLSRIIISLVALGMAAILFISNRPWGLTSNPRMDEIAVLPDDPRLNGLKRQIQWGDSLYPYISPKAKAEASAVRPRLKYGWTYREWNMLGMPFAAYPESGFAAFMEMRGGIKLALVDEETRNLIEAVAGRDLSSGYEFPWARHVWGWLIVLAVGVWQIFSLIEIRRAKESAKVRGETE